MKGPGVDQDAAVHISSTLTPLNKAVDTATARVECARIPVPRQLSFPDHPAPEAHKQLFGASKAVFLKVWGAEM